MINYLHRNTFLSRLFPTLRYCIDEEVKDCKSILDIGCGPRPVFVRRQIHQRVVGVEPFDAYRSMAMSSGSYDYVLGNRIEACHFKNLEFDAVLLLDVIEHMTTDSTLALLDNAKKWARCKVIISTPNGFVTQIAVDGNELQRHLSGWNTEQLKALGFQVHGMAGLKVLRRDNEHLTMDLNLTASIRFRPRSFWFIVAAVSQALTFRLPSSAFSLFAVWERNSKTDV